ncbi:imelysin family protein [Chondrinema litorale]|uniref:imelysin family protein n=1 Tax=Chondrinema litorale TaxID=2994555 RepID=UPI00254288AB|nr:imelysin family protein [Chondrinema litorale]UZR96931.1 imelysin family protein [Chondrinema litorale]
MKKYFLLLNIGIIVFGLVACDSEDNSDQDSFDRQVMLENIGTNIIFPSYETFTQKAEVLNVAAVTFSTEISSENLSTLQSAWKEAAIAWKSVEMVNFGPIDEKALETSIDNWPTNTNNIESAVDTEETIDEAYVINLGSSTKGLPAIEYLIFNGEQDDNATLDLFQNDAQRVSFLVALTNNLVSIATEISSDWESGDGNYVATFISLDGKDIGSSTNTLANALIILTEEIKNEKVGVPLGKKSLGEVLPNNLEAWRSRYSLELIEENLDAIDDIFNGGNSTGFDDYLDQVEAKHDDELLSLTINNQIDAIRTAHAAVSLSMYETLNSNPEDLETLYNELQKLVVLVKTDMMSQLGLLVTFSDNDGD